MIELDSIRPALVRPGIRGSSGTVSRNLVSCLLNVSTSVLAISLRYLGKALKSWGPRTGNVTSNWDHRRAGVGAVGSGGMAQVCPSGRYDW